MKINSILLFNFLSGHNINDLSEGSNIWQVKNYEEISETVYVLFLSAHSPTKITRKGRTIIIQTGSGNAKCDFLYAPWKIRKLVKRKGIKTVITYEQVFVWWFVLLLKFMKKCSVVLMPITMPAMMYKINKRSLSVILPIWVEKIFRRISSFSINVVIIPKLIGEYKQWLSNDFVFKRKLRVLKKVVEEVPSPLFFKTISSIRNEKIEKNDFFQLLCVSRLRKEKLIEDILQCMNELVKRDKKILLHIIGDGEDREYFMQVAKQLKIEPFVIFHGYLPLKDIVSFYAKCQVYISTLTGSALREVALFGMPVVAYEMDWVKDTFSNGINYLGVTPYDYHSLAEAIFNIKKNPELSKTLSNNIRELGMDNWSAKNLYESYQHIIA